MNKELDIFGKFLMKHFRDNAIYTLNALLKGKIKAPALQELQASLASLGDDEKEILKHTCLESLDGGLHDFLFALQEATDNNEGIEVVVNGKNIAELSDGLQGELFSEEGWFSKFSEYGEQGQYAL